MEDDEEMPNIAEREEKVYIPKLITKISSKALGTKYPTKVAKENTGISSQ
jgi:hypothetical protein